MFFRGFGVISSLFESPYYCGLEGPVDHDPAIPGYTLTGFQMVFRHGARTSLYDESCFGDMRADYKCPTETTFGLSTESEFLAFRKVYSEQGGCMRGQLIAEHAEPQLRRVADWVKKTYGDFVNNLNFRSTDIQRTLASMYFLRKLLLPVGQTSQNRVFTREYEGDALGMNRNCPKAAEKERSFSSTPSVLEFKKSPKYTACVAKWREVVQTEYTGAAFDCLASARCAGVSLPRALQVPEELFNCVIDVETDLRKIKYGAAISEYKQTALDACKLNVGPVLSEIRSRLMQGQSGLFASHDSTIACLLQASGDFWDGVWPKYAETLVFEGFTRGADNFVRIVRDGKIVSGLIDLKAFAQPDQECQISDS